MKICRLAAIVLAALMIVSCRLKIVVPEGGSVVSQSGTYSCAAGERCIVQINDIFFNETFVAKPAQGYELTAWAKRERALCAGTSQPCKLATEAFEGSEPLMDLLESDEVFLLQPVFVKRTDILRTFREGDVIKYTGSISVQDSGGLNTAEVTALREFFNTENEADNAPVMLHQLTLRLKSNGDEFPEASFYQQDRNGAWLDITDTAGNFLVDQETGRFGVLSYPSPLVPFTNEVIQFRLVAEDNLSNTLATGRLRIRVSKPKNISVAMGNYRSYKVTSNLEINLVAARTRITVVQNHWVAPSIGPIKADFVQETYDSRGNLIGKFGSELEATSINF